MASITSFTATPNHISKGGTTKLSWTSDGCGQNYLLPIPGFPNGKPVDANGSEDITLDLSTVFLITCGGECNQTLLVTVDFPIGG